MNQSVSNWQTVGFLFTSIAGTLLHFLFDWSGGSVAVAPFSAVNESTWEHMKQLYFPLVLFALVEDRAWGKGRQDFWFVKLTGTLAGLAAIPVLYYSYTGIFGVSIDPLNIAIFFIAAGAALYWECKLFQKEGHCPLGSAAAFFLLCLVGVFFVIFTFAPPEIPLFQDPLTGRYGFA